MLYFPVVCVVCIPINQLNTTTEKFCYIDSKIIVHLLFGRIVLNEIF